MVRQTFLIKKAGTKIMIIKKREICNLPNLLKGAQCYIIIVNLSRHQNARKSNGRKNRLKFHGQKSVFKYILLVNFLPKLIDEMPPPTTLYTIF